MAYFGYIILGRTPLLIKSWVKEVTMKGKLVDVNATELCKLDFAVPVNFSTKYHELKVPNLIKLIDEHNNGTV